MAIEIAAVQEHKTARSANYVPIRYCIAQPLDLGEEGANVIIEPAALVGVATFEM